jgi:hypothetical protein
MSKASTGKLGPNNIYNAAAYINAMKSIRSHFNYMNFGNQKYLYRGLRNSRVQPVQTLQNRLLRRPPPPLPKFSAKNIISNVGMSSWTTNRNSTSAFGKLVLRIPTSLLRNIRVGNLTKTREKEVILPPMKMVFNKNSTSNMVNVTNIIVNGRYVRNGSNTKKYIPRNYATRIKPNAV